MEEDTITVKVDTQNPEKPAEVMEQSTTPAVPEKPVETPQETKVEEVEVKEIPKDISFDNFETLLDKPITPKTPPPKKEEEKPAVKVEEKPPVKPEDKLTQTLAPAPKHPVGERDFTDIPEEYHAVLKQMSNDAFASIAPILKDHPKLVKELEETKAKVKEPVQAPFYEHERGYVLTPEWNELNQDASAIEYAKAHWMEQAAKIESGEDWQDLDIDKDGKFVKTDPLPSNAKAKVYANQNLLSLQAAEQQIKTKASEIIKGHKGRYQAATTKVTETVDKYLKKYDDPKNPYRGVVDNVLKTVPVEFHNHPMTRAFALLVANMVETRQMYDNTIAKLKTDTGFKEQVQKAGAGPTSKEINSGGPAAKSSSPINNVKFDDFQRVLQ